MKTKYIKKYIYIQHLSIYIYVYVDRETARESPNFQLETPKLVETRKSTKIIEFVNEHFFCQ